MFLVGRLGGRPKIPVRSLLKSVCVLVVVTEVLVLVSLGVAWGTRAKVYPERFYPADAFSLVCAQTVQLTAYVAGFVGAGVLLGVTAWKRRKGPGDP